MLEAARHEFANKGFAGARVDEIARRAGINKQALYYHFGSKYGLFREALESGYRQLQADHIDVDSKSAAEALADMITITFDAHRKAPDVIAMISDENRNKGRHLNREHVHAINSPLIDSIRAVLERGEREQVFRSGIDPDQFYISMISLVQFSFANVHTLSASLGRNLTNVGAIRKRRAHIVDLLLGFVRRN